MAQKTIVQLVDDLDQREIKDDGQTIRFGFQMHDYEIDLSGENAQKLHDALAPFIAAARRVEGRSGAGDAVESQRVRQWAREQGMKVNDRGRVPREVREAYLSAN